MAIDADLNCQVLFLDCARKEEDAVCSRSDFGRGGVKEEKPPAVGPQQSAGALCRRSLFCTATMVVFWPTLP